MDCKTRGDWMEMDTFSLFYVIKSYFYVHINAKRQTVLKRPSALHRLKDRINRLQDTWLLDGSEGYYPSILYN